MAVRELFASYGTTLGCDPELFVTRQAGRVRKRIAAVGSERIVPKAGLRYPGSFMDNVTRDGVQVELHAGSASLYCRQHLASILGLSFQKLDNAVATARTTRKDPSLKITFAPMVTLTRADMATLSPEARELSCKPSLNAYGREHITRDGSIYPIRTASGHLHLGNVLFSGKRIDPNDGVKICDLLIGIPCVLVDQDPSQKIRRETYGRAGEYRLPTHGLEYRVPSNFWLKDYKLQSMVFGLAKLAMRVCEGYVSGSGLKWAKDALIKKVDFAKVEQAINENDFDMALRIYTESIRPFADQIKGYVGFGNGLMDQFEFFVDRIHEKGLRHWFDVKDEAILDRWTNLNYTIGWECFLTGKVLQQMNAAKFTGIIIDPPKLAAARSKSERRMTVPTTTEPSLRIAA